MFERKSDSILFIANFRLSLLCKRRAWHKHVASQQPLSAGIFIKCYSRRAASWWESARKSLKSSWSAANHTLLQPRATQWEQSLVNHQIGYLKIGLSLTAGQQGLFDLEKSNKERVVSLVSGCGKWNKKTNDLREMDKGIAQRSDCGQKEEVEYIWHPFTFYSC